MTAPERPLMTDELTDRVAAIAKRLGEKVLLLPANVLTQPIRSRATDGTEREMSRTPHALDPTSPEGVRAAAFMGLILANPLLAEPGQNGGYDLSRNANGEPELDLMVGPTFQGLPNFGRVHVVTEDGWEPIAWPEYRYAGPDPGAIQRIETFEVDSAEFRNAYRLVPNPAEEHYPPRT